MAKMVKIIALTAMLSAALPTLAETPDPYERYNRAVFKFNDKADQYVMTPIARGYRKVTPKPARKAVSNFFNNLRDVNSFCSNLLRGNIKKAGTDFMRVAVNTTFGLGGLIDIAGEAGMPNNKNTLGDTFASWGWKNSNYLVIPLLGPSTVRDGTGSAIQIIYSPTSALDNHSLRNSLTGLNAVNTREQLLDATDTLNEMALDKYVITRETFMNMRYQQLGMQPKINPDDELIDPENDVQLQE